MLQHVDTVLAFAAVMLLLSLLVTTLVQAVVALLGLRGIVLRWGIERLLKQLDPDLKKHAKEIAWVVARHPTLCNKGQRCASAIRPEELMRLLSDVAREGAQSSRNGGAKGPRLWV